MIVKLLTDKRLICLCLSFFLPIILTIIYYSFFGAFTPYVRSALLQNIGYLSSWGGESQGLWQRLAILLLMTGLIYFWRKKLGLVFFLPAVMFLFGLYGVFLSERPYPHYFIEIAPWAALLLTALFFIRKKEQLAIALILLFLSITGAIKYDFWWYRQIPYYSNFIKFTLGEISKDKYFSFFSSKTLSNYQLAKYLKLYTKPEDPVFIWGDGACIYALSKRQPPGRYTVNYHIYDFNGYEETFSALEKTKTPIIVVLEKEKKIFSLLEQLLEQKYVFVEQINGGKIYKRLF